jgi:hypothetical protein
VKDTQTNTNYIFPCNKWLSRSKEDGEIARDLFVLIDENSRSKSRESLINKSPRGSARDLERSRGFDRSVSREMPRDPYAMASLASRDMGMARSATKPEFIEKQRNFERDMFKSGGGDRSNRDSAREFDRFGRDMSLRREPEGRVDRDFRSEKQLYRDNDRDMYTRSPRQFRNI